MKTLCRLWIFLVIITLGSCRNPDDVAGPSRKTLTYAFVKPLSVERNFYAVSDEESNAQVLDDRIFLDVHLDTASFPPKVWLDLAFDEPGDRGMRFARLNNFHMRLTNFNADGSIDTLLGEDYQYEQYSENPGGNKGLAGGGARYNVRYQGFDTTELSEMWAANPADALTTVNFSITGRREITGYISAYVERDIAVVEDNSVLITKLSGTFQNKIRDFKLVPMDANTSLLQGRMEVLRLNGKIKIQY